MSRQRAARARDPAPTMMRPGSAAGPTQEALRTDPSRRHVDRTHCPRGAPLDAGLPLGQSKQMFRLPLLGLLALATGGCAPGPDVATFGIPSATLAPIRLTTCPERAPAAATATHCPEEPR